MRNHRLLIYIVVILTFIACNSSADKKPLQPLAPFIKIASDSYIQGNKKEAIAYLDSAYHSFNSNVSDSDKFQFYRFMYDAHYGIGEQEKVGIYADSMLALFDNNGIDRRQYKKQYTVANFSKADWLYDIAKYQEAYKYYFTAKQQAAADGDSCLMGYYNHKLGIVFYSSSKYYLAINSFIEAKHLLNTCNDFGSYYRMQEIDDNIGLCYANLKKYDSALYNYNKSIELLKYGYEKYGKEQKLLLDKAVGVVYGNMGTAYVALDSLDKAEQLFRESIAINRQPEHDNRDALYTRIKLADLYLKKSLLKEAFEELDTSKQLMMKIKDADANLRWYNVAWKYNRAIGNTTVAADYMVTYINLKDSIDLHNRNLQRIELDTRVVSMEHDAQIRSLKKVDESRTKLLLLASVVALLTAIIAFLLYKNWSVSRRNYDALKNLNIYTNNQKEQLRSLLKDLGKATNEKDRILKAVSHDMRSPINASLALVDLIETDKETLSIEQQEYLKLLRESSNNALSLTKDLLEVATLSRDTVNKQLTDVSALAVAVIALLKFKAAEKQQKIELHGTNHQLLSNVDKEKITRVINNLINNAIKFSPRNATISVSVQPAGNEAQLSVKDSGIGIPDSIKDKVFDIFTEAKRFGTSGEQPYGLGLSISKQIIEVHDGRIWFESTEGSGTTFYVALPLA